MSKLNSCIASTLVVLMLNSAYAVMLDPTQPAWYGVSSANNTTSPTLSLIINGPDKKIAIINGNPIAEGETYNGIKVLHIGDKFVTFQQGDMKETLKLDNELDTPMLYFKKQ
jgi:hypothetical protein